MTFIKQFENWEARNWFLIYREYVRYRRRFHETSTTLLRLVRVSFFLVYWILSKILRILIYSLQIGGSLEHRFQVSPQHPSLSQSEHLWAQRQGSGPGVFLR